MGRIYDELPGHEGYVQPVGPEGAALTSGTTRDVARAVGHRAECSCGWQGPIDHSHPGEDLFSGDAAAGDALMQRWEDGHLASLRWRQMLSDAHRGAQDAQSVLVRAVAAARVQGASWTEIGDELGVSKQAAHERFARAVETMEGERG